MPLPVIWEDVDPTPPPKASEGDVALPLVLLIVIVLVLDPTFIPPMKLSTLVDVISMLILPLRFSAFAIVRLVVLAM
ncbi:MAG: hypothetical protein BGO12_05650 [Verrucomicrobia bacterium 61-8]|nr:MAG: hypothetical protein BGO12_05650 [Verrucomicrobia bacterium 61-8]